MQSQRLDIVELIERNPITKLSNNYQGKFIQKIQENFTDLQQKLIVASFFCYLNYNSKTDFIIDFDTIWKWLGFSRKEHCKVVLLKHFTLDIDYKIITNEIHDETILPKLPENNIDEETRGRKKEKIVMTINTFKKLCLKSNTKKADEIHDYFIKLEELTQETINEESNDLRLQLQNKESEKILEKHNLLLTRYAQSGSLVYFIKVKSYENGNFILRIGHSTIGLDPRFKRHKTRYEEAIILECFKVDKSLEFESFIHNYMNNSVVVDLEGHIGEKEIFLIKSQNEYNKLISLVKDNIKKFNKTDYVDIADLQNEINKLQNNNNVKIPEQFDKKLLNQIIDNQTKMLQLISNISETQNKLENTLITIIKNSNTRTSQEYNTVIKPLQGPKVIQINSETLKIHKVYNTIIELLNTDIHISRNSLKRAVEKKSIYRNYRWMFVNRDSDIKEIVIEHTNVNEEIKCIGYIAKLNDNKTEITNVYISMQEAVKANGKIPRNSQYYILYEQCDNIFKENFEKINGEPLLYQNGLGQFNDKNKLIKDFASKEDCFRKLNISRALLNKLIKENTIHNGFIYKYIGKKTQIKN